MPRFVVRYGTTRSLGVLATRGSDRFSRGNRVIARTPRGLEVGEVLCEATEEVVAKLENPGTGQILRQMSSEDEKELAHLQANESVEFAACERIVKEVGLQMQLVDIEHLFGGERIVVYYISEDRVDFRELVKRLASEFQTRIEMRQIGVRDEAKLLADYGDCGKPVCCNTHLVQMPPVSMKMAKLQKATLDPTKISGRCGRLKCCLRYEYDTYEELQKELPAQGAEVVTQLGRARVLNQEILAQQLLVQLEDNRRVLIAASEVLSVLHPGRKGGKGGPRHRDDEAPQEGERQAEERQPEDRRPDDRRPDDRGPRNGPRRDSRPRDKQRRDPPRREDQHRDNPRGEDRLDSKPVADLPPTGETPPDSPPDTTPPATATPETPTATEQQDS